MVSFVTEVVSAGKLHIGLQSSCKVGLFSSWIISRKVPSVFLLCANYSQWQHKSQYRHMAGICPACLHYCLRDGRGRPRQAPRGGARPRGGAGVRERAEYRTSEAGRLLPVEKQQDGCDDAGAALRDADGA